MNPEPPDLYTSIFYEFPLVMFLCDQSYASHGRDFLLGATILNPNAPFLVAYVTHVQTTPYEKNRE